MNGRGKLDVFSPQIHQVVEGSTDFTHKTYKTDSNMNNEILKTDCSVKMFLPKILMSNIRSFGWNDSHKLSEIENVLSVNDIEIAVFTETWASDERIEALKFVDYNMFHLIRKNCKKASGGISILTRKKLPTNRLNVNVPSHLEVMYVNLCPNWLPRAISNIIICGVYYPGSTSLYAPNQDDLISHLIESVQSFYSRYSSPLIIMLGDFNDLNINDILESCSLKQVVNVPTRNEAILDLILTNSNSDWFKEPFTLPKIGNSDHLCVVYVPKIYIREKNEKKKIFIRRFKKSAMIEFGAWIARFNWILLYRISDVNEKVAYFSEITWLMVEKLFPLQKVVLSNNDREWMTIKIKKLILQRQKAHHANKFELRDHFARKVRHEIKEAKVNYNKSKSHLFHMSNPREWYKHVNKIIGNKKHDDNFTNIPDLAFKPISDQIKIVNNHFAKICNKFPPLNNNIEIHIPDAEKKLKIVSEFDTYRLLKKYYKKSLGPGDLPQKILIEFAPELSTPFCNIINCAIQSNIFPDAYKKAEIIPIPKQNPPRSLSDLRGISKTPIGGKMIENVMVCELEGDTKGKINDTQYGNCKGSSTTHYLLKLMDQAYKSTDKGHATTAITIDYSKAFDYVNHDVLIQKLVVLGVRKRVIKLIISFLSNRSHSTCIQGNKSEYVNITCGVPQGTVTGPRLFVILINDDKCDFLSNYKFVDDKTLALSYSGNQTETLQRALDIESTHTVENKMTINENKCNVIEFNFSKKNKSPESLTLNGNNIQTVDKLKLLGVILTKDLKWYENTSYICSKVNRKLYILRKLKDFGLHSEELVNAWVSILRPNTEYAVPLWHSGLTLFDVNRLEKIQKRALGIIFGTVYIENKRYYKVGNNQLSYDESLQFLGLTTLSYRREALTHKFALQTIKNEKHKDLFIKKKCHGFNTRNKFLIGEIHCKTLRYYKSAIPSMSRTLNGIVMTQG